MGAKLTRTWAVGKSIYSWDETDKRKVKHMLGRGKSIEFIQSYTGMPRSVVEQIKRAEDEKAKGVARTQGALERLEPIAPDYPEMHREEARLMKTNREFVKSLQSAGLVPA